jgi:hypothetical protein
MRRLSLHLLAAVLGIALAVPPAALRAEEGRSVPVRLLSPQAGATLTAGSTVELEWAPLAELAGAKEWEAFLSLDGGATYPIRVTPHLDLDLRRVQWRVPAVSTRSARLLLRFGDEREEKALELPHRFAIVPALTPSPVTDLTLARVAVSPGEPALPAHSGVVVWVEGSRRGGSLRQVIASGRPQIGGRLGLPAPAAGIAMLATGRAPLPVPRPVRDGSAQAPPANRGSPLAKPGEAPPHPSDILLLTQRQNE